MNRVTLVAVLAVGMVGLSGAIAAPKPARCAIGNDYGESYAGPCRFVADRGGSFSMSRGDGKPLMGEILTVNVFVTGPGVAQVSGLTTSGISSRWGEARREAKDRACWKGGDFRICAY